MSTFGVDIRGVSSIVAENVGVTGVGSPTGFVEDVKSSSSSDENPKLAKDDEVGGLSPPISNDLYKSSNVDVFSTSDNKVLLYKPDMIYAENHQLPAKISVPIDTLLNPTFPYNVL